MPNGGSETKRRIPKNVIVDSRKSIVGWNYIWVNWRGFLQLCFTLIALIFANTPRSLIALSPSPPILRGVLTPVVTGEGKQKKKNQKNVTNRWSKYKLKKKTNVKKNLTFSQICSPCSDVTNFFQLFIQNSSKVMCVFFSVTLFKLEIFSVWMYIIIT